MKCLNECKANKRACEQTACRMWIDYPAEHNCTLDTVGEKGSLSLREAADRLGISFVRVKQIEDKALEKFMFRLCRETGVSRSKLKEMLFSS
tara:strand:+ start:151 stop:426 length:276 start_codon:yes stop_codon:yes gene_type:complete